MEKKMIYAIGVLVVLVLIFVGIKITGQTYYTTESGYLSVITSPSGAEVYIDGEPSGVTPVLDVDVQAGERNILLIKDGFVSYQTTKTIKDGQTTSMNVNLVAE